MRYVIFSDIHGNVLAFNQFLKDIAHLNYDKLIFLGDFVGYYYEPETIIRYCIDHSITCLLGNHDAYFLKMLDGELSEDTLVTRYGSSYAHARETISPRSITFLRTLDSTAQDGSILFCHGSPLDPLNGRIYPDTDLVPFRDAVKNYTHVISGHTHHKMSRTLGSTIFLNPGSLGQQRDGRGCSYLLLDTNTNEASFKTVDYDIATLESEIDAYDGGNERLKSVLRRTAD